MYRYVVYRHSGCLKQDICAVHGFAQAVYDVDEDARLDTEFRLNVKGMTALPGLFIRGTITAEAAGTSGKKKQTSYSLCGVPH